VTPGGEDVAAAFAPPRRHEPRRPPRRGWRRRAQDATQRNERTGRHTNRIGRRPPCRTVASIRKRAAVARP